MGVGRFVFTPIIPVMGAEVGLSTAGAGLLASVNYVGYLVGCLLAAAVGGWTATWYVAAVLALALAIPALRLARLPTDPEDDGEGTGPPPRVMLLVALGVAYFLEGAGYIITGTFLVDVATGIGP